MPPDIDSSRPPPPSIPELFRAFFTMALHGFGGVLPWARRTIVEDKRWMTAEEFNEAFAVSQFLPGANVVNLAGLFSTAVEGETQVSRDRHTTASHRQHRCPSF